MPPARVASRFLKLFVYHIISMVLTWCEEKVTLVTMFERFTDRARHVVVLAQEEARRLQHNYIGTEHILLGLLGEQGGAAYRALETFGMSLEGTRQEVTAIIGLGKSEPSGRIPFTPRAKKTLELALREALQLHHNYIGTEHILLGVIREGEGVGAQVMERHADLASIRQAVLDLLPALAAEPAHGRRWLRRRSEPDPGSPVAQVVQAMLSATPAADATLSEATRLAGARPVGSHHLLLAALSDPDTAAAHALTGLGIDLDQARAALRSVDVTGTSDEQPEEAGRRQLTIHVTDERLTIEAADPVLVEAGRHALQALGPEAEAAGTISGDLPACESLSAVWRALVDGLGAIRRRATALAEPPPDSPADRSATPADPDGPGTEAV